MTLSAWGDPDLKPNKRYHIVCENFPNGCVADGVMSGQATPLYYLSEATTSAHTYWIIKEERMTYSMEKALSVRDKRLSVIVDTHLAFKGFGYARTWLAEMTSSTGYTVGKYYTPKQGEATAASQIYYCNSIGTGYTDAPIYWLARVYLNYAEAKAELGTATQADLDNSINKLQKRAGLPNMTLNPDPDPANKIGVSNLIWEVLKDLTI